MMEKKKKFLLKSTSLLLTALFLTILNIQTTQPQVYQSASLDPNWITSPGYSFLHDGKILGRDFVFAYGPLFQLVSVLGAKLHQFSSSVFSLHLINLIDTQITMILLITSLLLIKFINWWESTFILLISNSIVNMRVALLITCITLLSTAFTKVERKHQFFLGGLAGCFAFLAQLYIFDMGVYSIFLIICLCLFFSLLSWLKNKHKFFLTYKYLHVEEYFLICLLAIIVFLILNLVLSFVFLYTSETYIDLFQYQNLSMNIIKGYVYQMGRPIHPGLLLKIFLFLITWSGLVILTITRYKKMKIQEAYYHVAYLAIATILIKNTLVRTDFSHLVIGFQGIMFFLPFAVTRYSVNNTSKIKTFFIWSILFLVVLSNSVYRNSFFSNDLVNLIKNPKPFQNLEKARNFFPDTNEISKYFYQLPLHYQEEEKIVVLGFRNYIAEFYSMELIAPTIQDYAITTPTLEDYVINSIDSENKPIILLDYGFLLDDIFFGTRYPKLFKYLLENYHMSSIESLDTDQKVLILERRLTPKRLGLVSIGFSTKDSEDGNLNIYFNGVVNCNLLKLGLTMDYPTFSSFLGTPGRLLTIYSHEGKISRDKVYSIGAQNQGEQFFVYLPTISIENIWQIFYSGNKSINEEIPEFNDMSFGIWGGWTNDPTYIDPVFSINSISCIQIEP